ncbi:MAG: ATP-binding cassette domain-containing protein, partial [Gammaproteobacteria bacterium]|nr:ATP-binding cassette domain-containing protein [Gammaproteobacteria bacterium]
MSAALSPTPLLEARALRVEYRAARGFAARERVVAVDDVGFSLQAGETLGLVGESGSGKSTLARAILRLVPVASGQVLWRGEDLLCWDRRRLREQRRGMQIVFQDPVASLDPRMTVVETVEEPLRIFEPALDRAARRARVLRMLERVGLGAGALHRYPHEFSGGQCQRIGIARAMMSGPQLLVCDEPVSALDVSIQGQIVNLLADLQRDSRIALLFISHNLSVVRQLSHRVLVMYRGRLLETATREALFAAPRHPYTRALLAAVPRLPRPGAAAAVDPTPAAGPAIDAAAIDASPDPSAGGCAYRA